MASVLGEMDVARVHPYRSDQESTYLVARPRSRTLKASGGHPILGGGGGGGAMPDRPLTRGTTSTRRGLRRASGDGGWRLERTKDGSVVVGMMQYSIS